MDSAAHAEEPGSRRPLIAFFDYPDLFDDFWPHYGLDQQQFLSSDFAASGHYQFAALLQQYVGDVVWYLFALRPASAVARHELLACTVRFLPASALYRRCWEAFWLSRHSWRWRRRSRVFATPASYLIHLSLPLVRALRQDSPACFFLQDYATGRFDALLLLAHLLGTPVIAYHTGSRPDLYLGRWLKRWTIRRADRLLASSEAELEMLIKEYGVSRDRVRVLLTPIDTEMFRPVDRGESVRALGLDESRRYILFLGRLDDYQKRISALLRIFATLTSTYNDLDFVIAGDGPHSARLREMANSIVPGRVRFTGLITSPADKVALYNAAVCLVMASDREGFPAVVGEAMACGTPVFAPRVGGIPELVVEGQTGGLCDPGDDDALARKIAAALSDPVALPGMRPRAREKAEARVSRTAVAAELRGLVADVLQQKH